MKKKMSKYFSHTKTRYDNQAAQHAYYEKHEIPHDEWEAIQKIKEKLDKQPKLSNKIGKLTDKDIHNLLILIREAEGIVKKRRANYYWHGEPTG